MNKKLFVLVVVCLLFAAACAHPFHMRSFRRHKKVGEKKPVGDIAWKNDLPLHEKPDAMFPGEIQSHPKPGQEQEHSHEHHPHHPHHHHHHHHHEHHHDEQNQQERAVVPGKKGDKLKNSMVIVPGKITEAVINYGTHFSVELKDGEALAMHIVHSSNKRPTQRIKKPVLSMCRNDNKKCITEVNNTISFQLNATEVAAFRRNRKTFDFVLTSSSTSMPGMVANLYACVGKNATLNTCVTPVVIGCVNGRQSKQINVCICDDGYTGKRCEQKSQDFMDDDDFEDLINVFGIIFSIVFELVFYIIVFVSITCCCVCLRACCQRRRAHRGSVLRNRTYVPQPQPLPRAQPIIPPPMYAAAGYRPLTAPPPPPPPAPASSVTIVQPIAQPQPAPTRRYDPYAAEGIEMSTIPAKPTNTVYVMPPLAPVKQVPVYIQPPPAPKN